MADLGEIYLVTGGCGFVYIIGSAVLGFLGQSGDGGSGDGDAGNADAGGDPGDLSNIDGDLGNLEVVTAKATASFRTGLLRQPRKRNIGLLLLKLLSPSTISMFAFFFGMCGYLLVHYFSALGALSLVPAAIAGVMGYNAMSAMTAAIVSKMHCSNSYRSEEVIGRMAEVTVPISPGKLGEITYAAGGVRDTAPARAVDAKRSFAKTTKVMIADINDGVYLVETWEDGILTDENSRADQKLRNS